MTMWSKRGTPPVAAVGAARADREAEGDGDSDGDPDGEGASDADADGTSDVAGSAQVACCPAAHPVSARQAATRAL
jgi:hypothetical protein